MKAGLPIALVLAASPASAQEMDHSHHAGMAMPMPPASAPADPPTTPAEPTGDPGIERIGNAPAPPIASDHAADRVYPGAMAAARRALDGESRFRTTALMLDQLEYRVVDGRDGYGWEGQAWIGGDIDRLAIASEGEGAFGGAPEWVELRALYRHAIGPYWNLEAGARHDFRPDPERTYAVIGIEGLAPYWFAVEGQLFVSNKGDVHARAEVRYDQRITQRLILEPSAEINLAAQDVRALGIGAGFERIELGARMRYEVMPGIGPYLGINWERKLGRSADFAHAADDRASGLSSVLGVRAWF